MNVNTVEPIKMWDKKTIFKETDRLCKVVELNMQCCGRSVSLSDHVYLMLV